ncbi:serine protease filzig [Leguminivora glycinivorella]|uniref:serine protease filzig n=1 Tax=Leguminivora glycinivorella TaxID=1035111 RepID=UPI002010B629|nr:serine protease filzig [Leguminivora glycinivorella]
MTVRECVFRVKCLVVLVIFLDILGCGAIEYERDSRKLFGGYRITPTYCKASRAAKYNRGNTICMFNHECQQRGGEVVGACMDGFLFGACCQLKSDSQSHIPKGPGVVMTSYLDYPEAETESDDYDSEALNAWHNSFKPIVTPGYRPGEKPSSSTVKTVDDSTEKEIISEGLSQITDTLLHAPPKEDNFVYIKPAKPDGLYTHSSIDHGTVDTVLLHKNGSAVDNVARPSDFNIQVSSMQTKPTPPPSTSTTTPKTVSTHRPIYTKPVFRPKNKTTTKNPTENYVQVSTVTKEPQKITETSINSIIQMLNESTPSLKDEVTSPIPDIAETKSSPSPSTATVSPVHYSSTYPNYYLSTGHYVTLKPSSFGSTVFSTTTTKRPSTTKKTVIITKKPVKYTTPNSIPQESRPSSNPYSTPKPSVSTSQAIDAFNRYPTNPSDFGDSVTTFSYVSSTTTPQPSFHTSTTRRPPSTSYVTGSKPVRRPVTSPSSIISSYDVAPETFSSVTPTVIVLNGFQTAKPIEDKEPEFVEISQEPFKKPVSQITVNNHIESTNNIYMGKPPQSFERPSSPTVVITPKPSPTTPFPIKSSTRPVSVVISTSPTFDSYTEYFSATTLRPEMQTSSDDLINFPPVRNPMLNATGSNPGLYNTSISLSDNELETLHDVDFTTPTWQEDEKLNEKMNLFVNKIVGSLQGTFQELHDIVILDKKPNATIINSKTTTPKPSKKPVTTRKPVVTTRKPIRLTTTTKRPTVKTTKKPVKLTTAARRPTTTTPPQTTTVITTTTKKSVTRKPTKPVTKPSKPAKTTTVAPTTVTTEAVEEVTTESYADQTIDYNDKNLCGVRPLIKSGRIVGGKNAYQGEWPWQVLVRESTWLGLFTKNKCGGVLITARFVTTAAHCQPGFLASLVAVFGENDISLDLEPRKPVSRNVRRVIVHRQYDAATFENDLALLELESPIKFDAHIVPICMPPDESDFTGRMATVTGWGRLKYGGAVPAVLQEVQVPVIENNVCQEMFQTAGHSKKILSSFLCAGYANGQKDSCEGDSGGPLVLQRGDGRWQLVGTVSHGIKCAAPYLPGVYMRTTFYKPWLRSITGVH